MADESEEWQAKDAIAQELDLSESSPTRKTFEEDDVDEVDNEEVDVLIKSGNVNNIDKHSQPKRKWSPRKDAFFFSKFISYFWTTKLLVKGSEKTLEEEDLEGIMPDDCLHPQTEALERNWYLEAYEENGKIKKNASLGKALIKTFGLQYLLIGFLPFVMEILRLVQPVFMGFVIKYFQNKETSSKSEAYAYAFAMVACFIGQSWTMVPFNYLRQMYGVQARVAVTGLVYKKVMNLSLKDLARSTTGFIVNLVSNDASKLELSSFFMHYLWIGPIELIIITALLVKELGPSALVGIGALLLLAPIQLLMGRLIMFFRRKILKQTDQRVKIMNEILTGMKVIKLYTWESSFSEWIRDLRVKEIQAIQSLAFARAGILSFFFSSGAFVSFITFMTYVLVGNTLTPQKVFTSVALFNVARVMFTLYFPFGITLFNEGRVAVERIQRILVEPDLDPDNLNSKMIRPKSADCGVTAENVTASWTNDATTLQGIGFDVKAGELLAIVGSVGSGKSSLLMAILGELPLSDGDLNVKGKIAYASQEAWVFNGTVRYNITFGHGYDEDRYNEVIKACALERDLELLAHGDQTLVGERGVSLSGGQKARVNLARAVYADADIYIMDDPLSAVDAHVGRHLYDNCINGYLSDKPRILVTHQVQYLKDADTILTLSNGKCIGKGTFYELNEKGIDFLSLVAKEDEDVGFECNDDEADGLGCIEAAKRRFSRQLECVDGELEIHKPVHSKNISFHRQITQTSYRSHLNFNESTIGIANDMCETITFEEETMDSNIPKETKQQGRIGADVFVQFFDAGYGKLTWLSILILFAVCQVIYILADWWLSKWANSENKASTNNVLYNDRSFDLSIYGTLVLLMICLGLGRAFIFFHVMLKTTQNIHLVMFDALMRAPMYFFDTNSIGRILNRFSKDTSLVDDMLSFTFFDLVQNGFVVIGIVVLVSINMPLILALVFPIIIAFIMLRTYYIKTGREIKRIEGIARSPIFGHFSTTLLGLPTIRAFRVQDKFFDILAESQDKHTEAYMSFLGIASWLSFNLDLLCGLFIGFTAFVCMILSDQFDAGVVGLMLAYAISIPGSFQQFVRQTTELENQFTSVERIMEYGALESEAAEKTEVVPKPEWPERGSIVFNELSFSYHKSLPPILHSISAHIKSKEKIGVCGRTGAGKSSLLSTLFRTAEPCGQIEIDGVDITKIGLKDLRSNISIIPQEPILFSGTMRKNLDPFHDYTDHEIWQALEEVQLKQAISELPDKLESTMAESGGNLSVGQRQLICLARAILKHNRVLVIDEATANVDPKTDALIQSTIREKFKDCTVLTIAHRLHTIMDSDRIMVLDAGNLKEFDEPYNLLRCRNSILYSLVAQTGRAEAQNLFEMTMEHHEKREKKKSEHKCELGDCGENCECNKTATKTATKTNAGIRAIGEEKQHHTDDVDGGVVNEIKEDEEAEDSVDAKEEEIEEEESETLKEQIQTSDDTEHK